MLPNNQLIMQLKGAPLSRDLTGLILPHEHYDSHLDSNGTIIDLDLKILNFEKAGRTLAEIWSESVIDTYPVIANYIKPKTGQNIINESITEK
jgi:hypothetical protein